MDSDSNAAVVAAGDRLSRLGDGVLGHVLSFLPATEAARAAALFRRWRHVFPAVHTLSFAESERPLSTGYPWFRLCSYCDPGHSDDVRAPRLVARAGAALHGRDRGAARAPPLRALRVAFDEFGFRGGDATPAVDGWLSYAAYHAAAEIDLRLDTQPICKRTYTLRRPPDAAAEQEQEHEPHAMDAASAESDLELEDDGDEEDDGGEKDEDPAPSMDDESSPATELYVTPRNLFSCAALRSLRLGGCRLDLPLAIALPALERLHLTRVTGGGGAVKRLVSACPRLADLTLEACSGLTDLTLPRGRRIRRLALRCCHELTAVAADSSELRAFEYRGAVPEELGFMTMDDDPPKLSFCSLDFCGEEPAAAGDSPDSALFNSSLTYLLRQFRGAARLHLTSARLGCVAGAAELPSFPALRNLELTGMVPDGDAAAVAAVARILERAPRLETLSLFFMPEPAHPAAAVVRRPAYCSWDTDDVETIHAAHKLRYDRYAPLAMPEGVEKISCLREKTREINLVHYQGGVAQRLLAKFLLRNAMVVDEVCCEFARGPLLMQNKLMEEMKGWCNNPNFSHRI